VGDALNELGRQTGLVIIVYSAVGRGVIAPRILGKFTPNRALDEILAHTGLHYEYLDSKTVAVLPVSHPRAVSKPIQAATQDAVTHAARADSDNRSQ
jgi:iron complex outermembrane receptor protein